MPVDACDDGGFVREEQFRPVLVLRPRLRGMRIGAYGRGGASLAHSEMQQRKIEKLGHHLSGSAMDAIFELDEQFRIQRANGSAAISTSGDFSD